jgi:hypothetical protein
MKYTVEMGSGTMIYVPSFIKIDSGIRKLTGGVGGVRIHRQAAWRLHKPTVIF